MWTKAIAILTLVGALVAATALTQPRHNDSNASIDESKIDCEYVVTPHGTTKTKGGDNC